jgi:hypothetical protein
MNPAARSWRALALLASAVAAVHLWVLDGLPTRSWRVAGDSTARWFVRTLDPATSIVATTGTPAQSETAPPSPSLPKPAGIGPAVQDTPFSRQADTPVSTRDSPPTSEAPAVTAQAPTTAALATSPGTRAAPAQATTLPASVRLRYRLSARQRGVALEGHTELAWQHDGQAYQAVWTFTGPAPLARTLRSTGAITPNGLAPLRFSERVRSEQAVHFDRTGGRLVFSASQPGQALAPGTQDRLSVLLQLGAVIAARPAAWPAGSTLVLPVATAQALESWAFTVEGEESLELPGGPVRALHLVRPAIGAFGPRLNLWLAPGLDYAPVRLRLTHPLGDWTELQWSGTDRG